VKFCCPENYRIENDGDIGTLVYLNDTEYIAISIPKNGLTGVEQLHKNINSDDRIVALSDDLHVFAAHGEELLPFFKNNDIVEIALNLPDGTGIIANVFCDCGDTEIYDLLLVLLNSIADAPSLEALENWLRQEWIPYISS